MSTNALAVFLFLLLFVHWIQVFGTKVDGKIPSDIEAASKSEIIILCK